MKGGLEVETQSKTRAGWRSKVSPSAVPSFFFFFLQVCSLTTRGTDWLGHGRKKKPGHSFFFYFHVRLSVRE